MHDALARIAEVEQGNTGIAGGAARGHDKVPAAGHARRIAAPGAGIDDMVHAAEHLLGTKHSPPFGLQAGQRNRAGALVEKNTIDVDQVGAVARRLDEMFVPKPVEKSAGHAGVRVRMILR